MRTHQSIFTSVRNTVAFLALLLIFVTGCKGPTSKLKVSDQSDQPRAVFTAIRHDMGGVMEKSPLAFEFRVENHGGAPLIIDHVKPECGCSSASRPGPIAPGGEGVIRVVIENENRPGQAFTRHFLVHSNDPVQPVTELTLTGIVEAYVSLQPKIAMLQGTLAAPVSCDISILPHPDHPFDILDMKPGSDGNVNLDLHPIAQNDPGQGYRLTVTNIRKTPGPIADFIYVITDLPEFQEFRIPIMGSISPAEGDEKLE